ncbi:MFS transporter [Photobacterium sp. DNB23_23_1]
MEAKVELDKQGIPKKNVPIQRGYKPKAIGITIYFFILSYLYVSLNNPDSMNLILPTLERTFGWAPADIAVRLGTIKLSAVIVMFGIGTLFMKVGIKKILIPCTIIHGFLIIAMSMVSTMDQFVYVNVAIAFVYPVGFVALGAIAANWFVRTRGRILGVITIAYPFSTATFTAIGTKGIAAWGYQGFYTSVGLFIILTGIAGYWLMYDKPEDVGLYPDGVPLSDEEKAEIKARSSHQSAWSLKRIIKTKELWAYAIAWSLVGLVMGSVMSQMIPVFTSTGISINRALAMLATGALAGIPLSYVWGYLDDKIGTPKTTLIFTSVLVTGALGMAYGSADNIGMFYLAIVCLAFGSAGMPNLQPSSLAYMVGRKELLNVQRYFHMVNGVFLSISMAYVPVMYSIWGSYRPVFLSLIGFIAITLIALRIAGKTFDPENPHYEGNDKAGNPDLAYANNEPN